MCPKGEIVTRVRVPVRMGYTIPFHMYTISTLYIQYTMRLNIIEHFLTMQPFVFIEENIVTLVAEYRMYFF